MTLGARPVAPDGERGSTSLVAPQGLTGQRKIGVASRRVWTRYYGVRLEARVAAGGVAASGLRASAFLIRTTRRGRRRCSWAAGLWHEWLERAGRNRPSAIAR